MGLGQQMGGDKMYKAAVVAMRKRKDCGALSLDLASAFTRIRRSEICEANKQKIPELGPWVVALVDNRSTGFWQGGGSEISVEVTWTLCPRRGQVAAHCAKGRRRS